MMLKRAKEDTDISESVQSVLEAWQEPKYVSTTLQNLGKYMFLGNVMRIHYIFQGQTGSHILLASRVRSLRKHVTQRTTGTCQHLEELRKYYVK